MHFKINEQLEYVSQFIRLEPGDLFLTGTPEGIAPIEEGDKIEAILLEHDKEIMRIDDVIKREH